MQSYKRKITYFYQHHNGNVGSTAGFLKLEIRGDKVKVIINIQEPPGLPYKRASLYFYHEAGDHLAAVKVGEIESASGMLAYQRRTDWQQIFDTGRDLYTFDGAAVVYNEEHYYIGDFQDKNRKGYNLICKDKSKETNVKSVERSKEEKQKILYRPGTVRRVIKEDNRVPENHPTMQKECEKTGQPIAKLETESGGFLEQQETSSIKLSEQEEMRSEKQQSNRTENEENQTENVQKQSEEKKNVFEKCESCPYHKKRVEQKEHADAFEKMLAEYPKLPMYGVTELFDCVRIHPKDIGKLDMRNWKLGVNSFLTHGYYTYQYLLLGKMRYDNGSQQAILGVPGVYSNREKYLANMFGFEQFIPIKKTGVKTGEFGYWIVEISPYL